MNQHELDERTVVSYCTDARKTAAEKMRLATFGRTPSVGLPRGEFFRARRANVPRTCLLWQIAPQTVFVY